MWLILTAAWMLLIFFMSARNADTSSEDSLTVSMLILRIFYPGFKTLSENAKILLAQSINHPVRKLAHASEYAVLGVLLFKTLKAGEHVRPALYAWGFAVLYAVTDEIHQIFVPGRSCQVTDIMIDGAGAAAGVLLAAALTALAGTERAMRRRAERRERARAAREFNANHCGGCAHNCPLTDPGCGVGREAAARKQLKKKDS